MHADIGAHRQTRRVLMGARVLHGMAAAIFSPVLAPHVVNRCWNVAERPVTWGVSTYTMAPLCEEVTGRAPRHSSPVHPLLSCSHSHGNPTTAVRDKTGPAEDSELMYIYSIE